MTVDVVVQPMKQHTLCAGNFERQWTVPFFLSFRCLVIFRVVVHTKQHE